jgi:uncharacterized protein
MPAGDLADLGLTGSDGRGCRIDVRLQPGARRDRIVGLHGARLKMTVTAPPERGKANDALARLLADALQVPASRVRVVAGFTSRDKTLRIDGLAVEEVRRRLGLNLKCGAGRDLTKGSPG